MGLVYGKLVLYSLSINQLTKMRIVGFYMWRICVAPVLF